MEKRKRSKAGNAAPRTRGSASRKGATHAKGTNKRGQKVFRPTLTDRMGGKKRMREIVIILFAVLMGVSMMTPSLAGIFGNRNAQQQDQQDQDQQSAAAGTDTGTASGIAAVDDRYQPLVSDLESKLRDDPTNLATLLGLGNDYMQWGYEASTVATTDQDKQHSQDLLATAQDYYNQYLALNDSDVVRVHIALCKLYGGDASGAQADLEALTQSNPDFGLAWANLGLVYEREGDATKATDAYNKAKAADPDDEYGAKSFAEQRLKAINAQNTNGGTGGSPSVTGGSGKGLMGTLTSGSGTNVGF